MMINERIHLAFHTQDPEQLRELSYDSSSQVRSVVAWRKDTPVEIVIRLTQDPDIDVRDRARYALKRRNLSQSV